MAMTFVYIPGDSIVHRLNPITKLLGLLAVIFIVFLLENILVTLLVLFFLLMIICMARLPINAVLSRPRFLIIFTGTIIASFVLFRHDGDVLFHFIPSVIPLGPAIPVTEFALRDGIRVALRFLVIISGSTVFASTTHPNEFVHSLTKVGIPYRYAFTVGLALRYVPIFDLEASTVRDARLSRGIDLEQGGLRGLRNAIRHTLLPLTASALMRVETLTITMEGRAFGLHRKRTFLRRSSFGLRDLIAICLFGILAYIGFLVSC